MAYHRHNQNYRPDPEVSRGRAFFAAFCTFLVFIIIGCLLAWRG